MSPPDRPEGETRDAQHEGLPGSQPPRRIGIFGGTFDPVHVAHVALARTALVQLGLDELRWVPTGHSWQKPDAPAPAADREAMVRLAIEGEPRFTLDLRELRRGGPGFTLDTVREMQVEQPGGHWFLVIGQDQYQGLHTWHDWPELLSRVTLAVARRPGAGASVNPVVQRTAQHMVALPMMDVSSTEVRSRVAAGLPIDRLVPPAVARYIDQHSLYHDGRGPPGS